ncbi:hypothetical protein SAMN05421693_1426, partial [Ectothiorhodospira magna]
GATAYTLTDAELNLDDLSEDELAIVTGATNAADYGVDQDEPTDAPTDEPTDAPTDEPTEDPGEEPGDYTLEEALAIVADEDQELPEVYSIDPEVSLEATASVAEAQATRDAVVAILAGAENTEALDIDVLFVWNIEDTAANILDATDELVVTGANALSITDDAVTVDQANSLSALENFDGEYALADTFAHLWAVAEESVVTDAQSYTLTDPAGSLGTLNPEQVAFVEGATNGADYGWGVKGETFTLTAGADVIEGTENDDTIIGKTSAVSSERTLNPADQIDGGEGNDTLKVAMDASFTGFSGDGYLKNVETVELTNEGSTLRTFSATKAEGVETYVLNAAKGAISLSNLAEAGITVNVNDQASGNATIGFTTDAVKGAEDALTLGVSNVGKVKATETGNNTYVTVAASGIEHLTVDAAGDNFVNLAGAASKTLAVKGDGKVDISAVATGVTSFDGSENTGGITANLTAVTGGVLANVKGGEGSDTLSVGIGGITGNASFTTGGSGNTLKLSGTGTIAPAAVSGFETIDVAAGVGGVILSGANVSDLSKVVVSESKGDVTLSGLPNADLTVELDGADNNSNKTVTYTNAGSVTFNTTAAAADVTAKTATAMDTRLIATNVNDVTINQGAYTNYNGIVTVGNADTVSFNSASGKNAATPAAEQTNFGGTISAAKATSLEVNAAGKLTGATFDMAKVTSANITADADSTVNLNTPELQFLNLATKGTFDFAAGPSHLSGLETLIVSAAKAVDLDTNLNTKMTGISSIELSGAGNDAKVTLGALGTTDNDKNITLTASGLKAGLETGTITTAASRTITVDAAGVTGGVKLGVASVNDAIADGTVTMTFGANNGTLDIAGATAKNVNIDASAVIASGLTGASFGNTTTVTAETATVKGANLGDNSVTFVANGTEHTLNYTGGIKNDAVVITSTAAETSKIKGTIALGDTGTDTLIVGGLTNTAGVATKVDLSELVMTGATTDKLITINAGAATALSEIRLSQYDDTVNLRAAQNASDKIFFNDAGKTGLNTINGFVGGSASADILNFNAFITPASASVLGDASNPGAAIANNTVYRIDANTAITNKDFGGANFGELFVGSGSGFLSTAGAAANAKAVLLVRGTDRTEVYYVTNNGDTTITADEVTLVGIVNTNTLLVHQNIDGVTS